MPYSYMEWRQAALERPALIQTPTSYLHSGTPALTSYERGTHASSADLTADALTSSSASGAASSASTSSASAASASSTFSASSSASISASSASSASSTSGQEAWVAAPDLVPDSYWTPSATSQPREYQAPIGNPREYQAPIGNPREYQAPIGNPSEYHSPATGAAAAAGVAATAAHASASDVASDVASAASFFVGFALVLLLLRAIYCAAHAAAQKWSRYKSISVATTGEPLQASRLAGRENKLGGRYERVLAAVTTRPRADAEAAEVCGEGGGGSCHAQRSSPPEPQRSVSGQQHRRAHAETRQARSAQVARSKQDARAAKHEAGNSSTAS